MLLQFDDSCPFTMLGLLFQRCVLPLFYSLVLLTSACAQPGVTPERLAEIDVLAAGYAEQYDFSGVVLVGWEGEVVWQGAYGLANHEHQIPNTVDTRFRIASLSKQFTATALLKLTEQGRVDLHVPIGTYLPYLSEHIGDQITTHHLLSHTSGLVRDIEELTDESLGHDYISLERLVDLINTSPIRFEPGSTWAYSNPGYILAAAVLEEVTGQPYGEALDALMFTPFDLKHTGHETSTAIIPNRATGYVALPDGIIRARHEDKSYVIGAGSIYSTAADLFQWVQALRQGSVLEPDLAEQLFTPHTQRYGYGWFVDTYVWPPNGPGQKGRSIHHGGDSPGFTANVSIYDDHDLVVVMLSNQIPSYGNLLYNQIGNLLLGFEESLPRPPDTNLFYSTLFTEGIDATAALVQRWRDADERYRVPRAFDVFLVGRGYLDAQRYDDAIRIMDLLSLWRPKWAYPPLFKGFALYEMGKIDEAKAAFETVLMLDPNQSNAQSWLRKLADQP